MGAMCGGASDDDRDGLGAFGRAFGLAFQIADDLLDVSGTSDAAGKQVGKDAKRGKQTWPACVGVDESRRALAALIDEAVAALALYGPKAEPLRDIARSVGSRHY
jgi:geranylgeranyl pyrophosphate synthase